MDMVGRLVMNIEETRWAFSAVISLICRVYENFSVNKDLEGLL